MFLVTVKFGITDGGVLLQDYVGVVNTALEDTKRRFASKCAGIDLAATDKLNLVFNGPCEPFQKYAILVCEDLSTLTTEREIRVKAMLLPVNCFYGGLSIAKTALQQLVEKVFIACPKAVRARIRRRCKDSSWDLAGAFMVFST